MGGTSGDVKVRMDVTWGENVTPLTKEHGLRKKKRRRDSLIQSSPMPGAILVHVVRPPMYMFT